MNDDTTEFVPEEFEGILRCAYAFELAAEAVRNFSEAIEGIPQEEESSAK